FRVYRWEGGRGHPSGYFFLGWKPRRDLHPLHPRRGGRGGLPPLVGRGARGAEGAPAQACGRGAGGALHSAIPTAGASATCVTAEPAVLARRLELDCHGSRERPALTAAGTLHEIAQVLEARTPFYQGLADAVIETDARSPEDVADVILGFWLPRQCS